MFTNFDWSRIKAASIQIGLEWNFSPTEAPWYNGSCEALIDSIKKCLTHTIGAQKMS